MAVGYVVREPFGGYAKGDLISDQAKVAEIDAAGDRDHHVLRVAIDDPTPAMAAPKSEPAA